MIFAIFQEVVQNTKKVQLLNFGSLPPGQFPFDFNKISDLGYLNLYLQHILGASKSGKLDDPGLPPPPSRSFVVVQLLQWLHGKPQQVPYTYT